MVCFLACFGGSEDRKRRRRRRRRISSSNPIHESQKPSLSPPTKPSPEAAVGSPLELREKQEHGSFNSCRKKVTFDLNVKTYEDVSPLADSNYFSDEGVEKEDVEDERKAWEEEKSSLTSAAYPASHRYQNYATSDDDDDLEDEGKDDDEYEESDFDEEDQELAHGENEESYDSYFSLPMDRERDISPEVNGPKLNVEPAPEAQTKLLACKNARDRSQYVYSVLNPVENITQWKEVTIKAAPLKPQKENINAELDTAPLLSSEPAMKIKATPQKHSSNTKEEVSVDASLSTWLITPENSTGGVMPTSHSRWSNSPSLSREEQPILGALTIEDLKQSVTSSPRRSPSRSPDEMPILGSVGSYWSSKKEEDDSVPSKSRSKFKGIPNTASTERRVNWHDSPFEVRMEKALDRGADEACLS